METSMETRNIAATKLDGCIPLTVGIDAQPTPRHEERDLLQSRLAVVLDDLDQEYSHTPIVLVTVEGDTAAEDVARATGRLHWKLPSSCQEHISQCSVLVKLQNGICAAEWRRDRQKVAKSPGQEQPNKPMPSGSGATPASTFWKGGWACVTFVVPYRFGETIFASRRLLDTFNADV